MKVEFQLPAKNLPVHFFTKKLSVATKESIFVVLNHVVNLG